MAFGKLIKQGVAAIKAKRGTSGGGSRSGGFITPMPANNTTKRPQAPAGVSLELAGKVIKSR